MLVRFAAFALTLAGLLLPILADGPHGAAPWVRPELGYRMRVELEPGALHEPNTPCTASLDFARLLRRDGGDVAPDSIVVVPAEPGPHDRVPVYPSESLAGGSGTVSWLAPRAADRVFWIYFDTLQHRKRALLPDREPVGVGDPFYYNRPGEFDPLGVGMTNDQPSIIDWDGDGHVDLLQRNIYSYAYGEPYWGLFFWRNIGSDRHPRFDRYLRVRADGHEIADPYASYQVLDWNGDGLPDIVSGSRNTLRVYLNTGRRDAWGMPVLHLVRTLALSGPGDLSYGMRLVDWTGGNHPDLWTLRSTVQYFPEPVVDYTWYRHPNLAHPGEEPRFGPPEPLALAGQTRYPDWPMDFYDWEGRGPLDLIGVTEDRFSRPARPCVVVWRNTGTRARPAFMQPPARIEALGATPGYLPIAVAVARAADFNGLFLSTSGVGLRFFERVSRDGPATFVDRGPLLAREQPVSSGGFNCAEVADLDGDGRPDFICGDERGFVHWFRNVSRGGRTMFAPPQPVLAGGKPLRVARWTFLDDHDPEANFGQSKPCAGDWDGRGVLDLLVGNNTNRVALYRNLGTRRHPRFGEMETLRHDDPGGEYFSFRKHPVIVDWDGDGLADLVDGDQGIREKNDSTEQFFCLFRRYRAADGTLHLGSGEPFRDESGAVIRRPIPYVHGFEVASWNGDGRLDLFTNEGGLLYRYENVGTNARPRFRRRTLTLWGQPIRVGHHETSIKVVDWDGTGRPDLICGGEAGWIYLFRHAALVASAPPACRVGDIEARWRP